MKSTILLLNVPMIPGARPDNPPPHSVGLMSIAAAVDVRKYSIVIYTPKLDLNGIVNNPMKEYLKIANDIQRFRPYLIGFSSLCSSYHHTVSLAKEIKILMPHVPIVFGGTQASITDMISMEAFPFIDYILRGEADYTFSQLLHTLEQKKDFTNIPGLTYRKKNKIVRNPDAPPIKDLDALPFIDYRLLPKEIMQFDRLELEGGRGCPYNCTFCATSGYFRHFYRLKSPKRLIAEMRAIHTLYPHKTHFTFTHDNFTVNRKLVIEFCRELIKENVRFTWDTASRVNLVDRELLMLMKRSGCTRIFFGVESGSQRMQKIIGKNLIINRVKPTLWLCHSVGIATTASFIVGFPEETNQDIEDTLHLVIQCKHFGTNRVELHGLSPLPGSALNNQYADSLYFSNKFISDIAEVVSQKNINLVKKYPKIFSAHYRIPTPHVSEYTLAAIGGFGQVINNFPKILFRMSKMKKYNSFLTLCKKVGKYLEKNHTSFSKCKSVNEQTMYIMSQFMQEFSQIEKDLKGVSTRQFILLND